VDIRLTCQTDGSDPDAEEPQYLFRIGKAGLKEVERGYVAEAVRIPDGAAAHERGANMWEDFIKKVQLGEDLNPQMRALDGIVEQSVQEKIERSLESLLNAVQVICDQETGKIQDATPKALSMLADTALAEPPTPHLPQMRTDPNMQHAHRTLLPTPSQVQPQPPPPPPPSSMTHGPTDPRSFLLPRPSPILSQPRHLLPARGQLGLPDPFSMNGPPQLPPPPGSNFRSLPLPNYLPPPGHPQQPGPPGPGPGPGHMYYPPPHGHAHGPPPPPPRRY
jgi:hypothetical protein